MNIIDRYFVAVFSRYRRKPGHNLDSAWRAAEYQVGSFLALPFVVLVAVFYAEVSPHRESVIQGHDRAALVVAVAVGFLIAYLLQRRFRAFLHEPPKLSPVESRAETHLVWAWRLMIIAICGMGFALAYLCGSASHG